LEKIKTVKGRKMDLSKISGKEILFRLDKLVRSERKLTHIILSHIYEVESRRLYFDAGFSSTVEYLKKGLGYSDDGAYTRFRSAQLLGQMPALEEKLESGAVNLSQLTEVQKAVRLQTRSGQKISAEQTEQIIEKLENKNIFETRLVLAQELNLPIHTYQKIKPQADESVRVEITFTAEEFALIQKAKDLLSHQVPSGELSHLFIALAKKQIQKVEGKTSSVPALENLHPKKNNEDGLAVYVENDEKIERTEGEIDEEIAKTEKTETQKIERIEENKNETKSKSKNEGMSSRNHDETEKFITQQFTVDRKYETDAKMKIKSKKIIAGNSRKKISIKLQREIFKKARYRCEFVDRRNHSQCNSSYQLQIDHIKPVWAGGADDVENLRCLCATHNRHIYRRQSGLRS
jgi:hypothetical protein